MAVCSDHEMMEFKILRVTKRVHSKLATLDFKRADLELFRELFGRATWEKSSGGKCSVVKRMQRSRPSWKPHLTALHEMLPLLHRR